MPEPTAAPCILVDYRKNRIRIHKNTLRLLGQPKYVRLLVNPLEPSVAVQLSDASDPRAHRVPSEVYAGRSSYEIYNQTFIQQLSRCSHWDFNTTYRMYASACLDGQFLIFRISDSVQLNDTFIKSTTEGSPES